MIHFWVTREGIYGWLAQQNLHGWAEATEEPWAIVGPESAPVIQGNDDAVLICGGQEPTQLARIDGLPRVYSALVPIAGELLMIDPIFLSLPAPGERDGRYWMLMRNPPVQPVGTPYCEYPQEWDEAMLRECAHGGLVITDDMGCALWAVMQGVPLMPVTSELWGPTIEMLTNCAEITTTPDQVWTFMRTIEDAAKTIRHRFLDACSELRDETVAAFAVLAEGTD